MHLASAKDPLICDAGRAEPPARYPALAHVGLVAAVTFALYLPTIRNGFLLTGFDDSLIVDNPMIRALSVHNLWAMATQLYLAHYVPLTFLSLAVDYHFWILNPFGYHLTNIVLHSVAAVLAWFFLDGVLRSRRHATLGALIFSLHPVQLEAVSVAIQRKTLLAGCLFFGTLLLYRRWRSGGTRRVYLGCVAVFAAAVLAKPSVATLPLVLILYDYCFVGGRLRLLDKLPFFFVAAGGAGAAVAAHVAAGAVHALHGGSVLTHSLLMSRIFVEYAVCLLAPFDLAPTYYYRRSMLFTATSFLALAAVVFVPIWVTRRRRRAPWSFFCLAWFLIVLLPEANLVPLAQPRADRFLYLAMFGFAMRLAVAVRDRPRIPLRIGRSMPTFALAAAFVGILALITQRSTNVWRDQVTARARVVERYPWAPAAHYLLGIAASGMNRPVQARDEWLSAIRINPKMPGPYLRLARWYSDHGQARRANEAIRWFLDLQPGDAEGLQLLEKMREPHGKD